MAPGDGPPASGGGGVRRWRRLTFDLPVELEETVGTWLDATGALGAELAPVGHGRIRVAAYYPESAEAPLEDLASLARRTGVGDLEVRQDLLPDGSWAEAYQRSLVPFAVGDRFRIFPAEEPPGEDRSGRISLHVPPGRAFGTGDHPTTRLCLEYLERRVAPGSHVLDVGTGSGILAIAAIRLGASWVVAVEPDREAAEVAAGNFRRNGVAGRVDLVVGRTDQVRRDWFDVVTANILAGTLVELMPEVATLLRPGGRGVLSGIRRSERTAVSAAAAARGLGTAAAGEAGGWVAMEVRKPGNRPAA